MPKRRGGGRVRPKSELRQKDMFWRGKQQYKKEETEVSLRLSNFCIANYETLNLGTKVRNLPWKKRGWSRSRISREIGVSTSTVSRS